VTVSRAPLRSDAARNRARLVAAAREVFAEHGLEAPMVAVAERAGVGIATLFRRFPTREDLIAEIFAPRMSAYADAIDSALADPDPWHGFRTCLERICAMQAADRGFTHVLTMTFPTATALEADRDRAYRGMVRLMERAKAAGRLRPDFVAEDVVLVLMANAGVIAATGNAAPASWRRVVGYLLQAFGAEHAQPLPAPPSPRSVYRAMTRIPGQHPEGRVRR
jgi:AcrR family transcriptional regulator